MTTSTTKPGQKAVKAPAKPAYYQSGFCTIGSHENVVNKSPSGKTLKSCPLGGRFYYPWNEGGPCECMCSCHATTREMEKLTGIEIPMFDSKKQSNQLSGLGLLDGAGAGTTGAQGAVSGGVNRPTVVTASGASFVATPTGRRAKGQLEEEVRTVISSQVKTAGDDMIAMLGLTPELIANSISKDDPPSSGAIYSILKTWENKNYVELGAKPFRFVRFTDRGKRDLLQ